MGSAPPPGSSRARRPHHLRRRAVAPPCCPVAGATGGPGTGDRGGGHRPVLVRPRRPTHRRTARQPARSDRRTPQRRAAPVCARRARGGPPRCRNGSDGARSARGYPAPVSTPVGADPAVVGPYLASVLGDERWARVRLELIAAGMSNLTYVVTPEDGSDDDAVILRRPPTGAVLATAHDMAREHRVVSALGPTPVPVPRTLPLCTDTAVLGAPFYVMERVVGLHVVDRIPAGYADEPAQRRAIGEGVIDGLPDLHAVDHVAVGLGDFGRPEGFMARQVRRWTQQWDATPDRERPGLDAL